MLERFAQDFQNRNPQVTLAGLRFCNVYGPAENHKGRRASMIYQLARQMQAGSRPRIFRSGEQKRDRKSTCLNSSHSQISYAVFCLKKKKTKKKKNEREKKKIEKQERQNVEDEKVKLNGKEG